MFVSLQTGLSYPSRPGLGTLFFDPNPKQPLSFPLHKRIVRLATAGLGKALLLQEWSHISSGGDPRLEVQTQTTPDSASTGFSIS